jgi:hypothetical protein
MTVGRFIFIHYTVVAVALFKLQLQPSIGQLTADDRARRLL